MKFSGCAKTSLPSRRTRCLGKVELPTAVYRKRCEEKIALLQEQLDSMEVKSGPEWCRLSK